MNESHNLLAGLTWVGVILVTFIPCYHSG